jgi:tetratricopeptide (TPR) repeat protein
MLSAVRQNTPWHCAKMRRCVRVAASAALMLMSVGFDTRAQDSTLNNFKLCNDTQSASLDQQIGGCTALIDAGALMPQGLAVAFNTRGIAYTKKGDYDRAIQDYDESIKINPKYAKAFNNRGVAYRKKGDHDRAIQDFDESIKLDSNYAIAFANRAATYQEKGEYNLAARDYDEVIRLKPIYESAIKDQPELGADWKRVLETLPNERCWTHAVTGDLQNALAYCNEAIQSQPNVAQIRDSRGLVYLKMGRWDAAIEDYNLALRIDPKLASSLYGRGLAKLKKGNSPDGNVDIDTATAISANIVTDFQRYGLK